MAPDPGPLWNHRGGQQRLGYSSLEFLTDLAAAFGPKRVFSSVEWVMKLLSKKKNGRRFKPCEPSCCELEAVCITHSLSNRNAPPTNRIGMPPWQWQWSLRHCTSILPTSNSSHLTMSDRIDTRTKRRLYVDHGLHISLSSEQPEHRAPPSCRTTRTLKRNSGRAAAGT